MGRFIKGDVVVLPFPFSDLSTVKRRPALVIQALDQGDLILCMITSQALKDALSIKISPRDFTGGQLKQVSYVKPHRIFTAAQELILYRVGSLSQSKIHQIIERIVEIISA